MHWFLVKLFWETKKNTLKNVEERKRVRVIKFAGVFFSLDQINGEFKWCGMWIKRCHLQLMKLFSMWEGCIYYELFIRICSSEGQTHFNAKMLIWFDLIWSRLVNFDLRSHEPESHICAIKFQWQIVLWRQIPIPKIDINRPSFCRSAAT